MIDAGLPVRAFFTTREGGISAEPYASLNVADHVGDDPHAVARNRALVAAHAQAPVTFLRADHGIGVHHVTAAGTTPPWADVLVTVIPGLAVAAIAADCVPVLLHDQASGAVAAVHAGREGLYQGVVDAAVASLLDVRGGWRVAGAITAAVGPAICGRCYEVPEPMRAQMATRHPVAVSTTSWGTAALDLPRAVETRLGQLGVDRVVRHRRCTYESSALFSHRRDGVTGRIAGVVVCG